MNPKSDLSCSFVTDWRENRIYRLVRMHWNKARFAAVKNQFQATYRRTLKNRVEGEVSLAFLPFHKTKEDSEIDLSRLLGNTRMP